MGNIEKQQHNQTRSSINGEQYWYDILPNIQFIQMKQMVPMFEYLSNLISELSIQLKIFRLGF